MLLMLQLLPLQLLLLLLEKQFLLFKLFLLRFRDLVLLLHLLLLAAAIPPNNRSIPVPARSSSPFCDLQQIRATR